MVRILLAVILGAASCVTAVAAPTVPGRAQLAGDVIKMGQQFHIKGDNIRILSIRVVAGTDPLAQTLHCYAPDPTVALIYEVTAKNTWPSASGAPGLNITAFYKDGSSIDDSPNPILASGKSPDKLYPGQGVTVYYCAAKATQPTKDNPITKLLVDAGVNDDGYPPAYRLLDPVVKQ